MANIGDDPRLLGLLQRARDINNNGVPRNISNDVAESIIDGCRDGVAPKSGALFIAVGREQLFLDLRNDLKLVYHGASSLRIINGELGTGKSFLLRVIEEYAIEHDFATSFITLSNRECPMHDLTQVYRFIVRNMGIGSKNDTIEDILDKWAQCLIGKYGAIVEILRLIPDEIKELDHDFLRALTVYFESSKFKKLPEKYLALRWIRGETNISDARNLKVSKNLTENNALSMLGHLTKMLKFLGKGGLVILMDEIDTISQIMDPELLEKAFANTSALSKAYIHTPYSYFAFATTPAFMNSEVNRYSESYHNYTDVEYLRNPDLLELSSKIRDLHFRVYGWNNSKVNRRLLWTFVRNCSLRGISTTRDFLRLLISRLDYCEETRSANIENAFSDIRML
ncbi:BREX system ATP-binding domain-containing protein [Bacteroidota bacterium]